MSRRFRGARAGALAVSAALALGACGGGDGDPEPVAITELEPGFLPRTLGGLAVVQEDMGPALEGLQRPYVDAVGLWSVRNEDDVLQATIQISSFTDDAPLDDDFRRAVISQIGTTTPKEFRMGDQAVWITAADRQSVAVWFAGDRLMVLSARDDFVAPRKLLREALELAL